MTSEADGAGTPAFAVMTAIAAGQATLARGMWAEARDRFGLANAIAPSVDAYEELGIAARYLLDGVSAFAAHEAGFQCARDAGGPDAAARLAVQLSYDAH